MEVTISDILRSDGKWEDSFLQQQGYCLYVVSFGKFTLYVGSSAHPWKRLHGHMATRYARYPKLSPLGDLLKSHRLLSHFFSVTFYRKGECLPLVKNYRGEQSSYTPMVEEAALIAYFQPCLNHADNPTPSRLPWIFWLWKRLRKHRYFWLI